VKVKGEMGDHSATEWDSPFNTLGDLRSSAHPGLERAKPGGTSEIFLFPFQLSAFSFELSPFTYPLFPANPRYKNGFRFAPGVKWGSALL
jgi:hypothetical protein